jgi:hypothetical protein
MGEYSGDELGWIDGVVDVEWINRLMDGRMDCQINGWVKRSWVLDRLRVVCNPCVEF